MTQGKRKDKGCGKDWKIPKRNKVVSLQVTDADVDDPNVRIRFLYLDFFFPFFFLL
jgi:hypothetical protein